MLEFNLRRMDQYLHLFDGQIIVKVAGVARKDLPDCYEILRNAELVYNLPTHEAEHFKESLSRLRRDGSVTFYAHAKGVSREPTDELKMWVDLMYRGNLQSPPNLKNKLFSGCFAKLRKGSVNVPVPWHYSGTFYWFRNDEVLRRYANSKIPGSIDNRWFTENFPGWIARKEEAELRLYSTADQRCNFYSPKFWSRNRIRI